MYSDEDDDGTMQYDTRYPPLFVKPPPHQEDDYKHVMKTAIASYLQESHRNGLKNPNNILDSGLQAGEAGWLRLRALHQNRKKANEDKPIIHKEKLDVQPFVECTKQALAAHMGLHIETDEQYEVFNYYITEELFLNRSALTRKLRPALKKMITALGVKQRGYTTPLRSVVKDIESFFDSHSIKQNE